MIFESVKFALSWFISLKCTCDETEGVPIWKGHAHPCPPRMDRTLAAEEQYRQQDGGSSLKRGHHDISWPQRSSYYKIYKGILHSRTLQVSEGKRSIFSRLLKKKTCEIWYHLFFPDWCDGILPPYFHSLEVPGRNLWDVKGRHGTLLGTVPVVSRCLCSGINGYFRNLNWRYLPYIRPIRPM